MTKDTIELKLGGRPNVSPENRMGTPVRALVTIGVAEALQASMELHNLPGRSSKEKKASGDILRLAIFNLLQKDRLMTPELYNDPTWNSLKAEGLV